MTLAVPATRKLSQSSAATHSFLLLRKLSGFCNVSAKKNTFQRSVVLETKRFHVMHYIGRQNVFRFAWNTSFLPRAITQVPETRSCGSCQQRVRPLKLRNIEQFSFCSAHLTVKKINANITRAATNITYKTFSLQCSYRGCNLPHPINLYTANLFAIMSALRARSRGSQHQQTATLHRLWEATPRTSFARWCDLSLSANNNCPKLSGQSR